MNDASSSGMRQASGDLEHVVNGLGNRQMASAFEERAQVIAFDELEGDEMQTLVFSAIKDPSDILVIEFGSAARLLMEPKDVFLIGGHLGRQDLERDQTIELRIARPQNGGHATHANRFDQLKVSQATTGNTGGVLDGDRRRDAFAGDDRGRVIGRGDGPRQNIRR
jgi:hypothetical protein